MRIGAAVPLAALLIAGGLLGCSKPQGPVLYPTAADLKPDADPGQNATLRLGDGKTGKGTLAPTEFDVKLRYARQGSEVALEVSTQGEAIEHEEYESSPAAFRILSASEEAFSPGIDLVRFPAHDGENWEWSGRVIYAGIERSAQATVHLQKEAPGLLSEVQLKIQADPGRPDLQRRFRFWFQRDKGVVRRSFGDISTRLPAGDTWLP